MQHTFVRQPRYHKYIVASRVLTSRCRYRWTLATLHAPSSSLMPLTGSWEIAIIHQVFDSSLVFRSRFYPRKRSQFRHLHRAGAPNLNFTNLYITFLKPRYISKNNNTIKQDGVTSFLLGFLTLGINSHAYCNYYPLLFPNQQTRL